jgi:hypothetical protein
VRLGDRAGEPVITVLALGQHQQVTALGVRDAVLRGGQAHRQLRSMHGRQVVGLGGLGEAGRAVEAVVIGQRQGVQPEPHGLLHQVLRRRRTIQEAEVRMRVQLGVRNHRAVRALRLLMDWRRVRGAVLRPRRAVPTVFTELGGVQKSFPCAPGELLLEIPPRDGRILVSHRNASSSVGPPSPADGINCVK